MIQRKKVYIIIITCLFIISILSCWYLYKTGLQKVLNKANIALVDAVDKELDYRFAKLDMPITIRTRNDNRKAQRVKITTEDGESVIEIDKEKEKKAITSSFEKRTKQSIVTGKLGITPLAIDSIWNVELQNRDIRCETGISITYSGLTQDSDSIILKDKTPFQSYYAGSYNEIQIYAYLSVNFLSAIYNGNWGSIYMKILIFLFFLFIFFLIRFKPEVNVISKGPINFNLLETGIIKHDDNIFQLGNLFFDTVNMYLSSKNEVLKLRPQLAKLLKEFLLSPNYYLKSEYLCQQIWGNTIELGMDNRLQKLVSDLRKFLQIYTPQIRIEFELDGYRLFIEE